MIQRYDWMLRFMGALSTGFYVFYADHLAEREADKQRIAELEKFKAAVLKDRCRECPFLESAQKDFERIEQLEAENAKYKAIEKEQLDIIFQNNPITCRDGVRHDIAKNDDCCQLCKMKALTAENAELREGLERVLISSEAIDCHIEARAALKEAEHD